MVTLRNPWLKKCARAASTIRCRPASGARFRLKSLSLCFISGIGSYYTIETILVYLVSRIKRNVQQNFYRPARLSRLLRRRAFDSDLGTCDRYLQFLVFCSLSADFDFWLPILAAAGVSPDNCLISAAGTARNYREANLNK